MQNKGISYWGNSLGVIISIKGEMLITASKRMFCFAAFIINAGYILNKRSKNTTKRVQ